MSCIQSQQLFDGTIRQNLFTDEKDEAVQAIFKQLDFRTFGTRTSN